MKIAHKTQEETNMKEESKPVKQGKKLGSLKPLVKQAPLKPLKALKHL